MASILLAKMVKVKNACVWKRFGVRMHFWVISILFKFSKHLLKNLYYKTLFIYSIDLFIRLKYYIAIKPGIIIFADFFVLFLKIKDGFYSQIRRYLFILRNLWEVSIAIHNLFQIRGSMIMNYGGWRLKLKISS